MDLHRAWINLPDTTEITLVLILALLLNLSSGMAFSLYAPSMPAIAVDFHSSIPLVKNTISVTMLGFAIGSFISGLLLDRLGRRRVLLVALSGFIVVSLLAISCRSIYELMLLRFLQGAFTSAMAIGGRAMIVDRFSGKKFMVAILYTSIAYALGLVIGPFIGGALQTYVGWQANFVAYAVFGCVSLLLLFLFVNESLVNKTTDNVFEQTKKYYHILMHEGFFFGIILLAVVQLQQVIYPTLAVFVIIDKLHFSPSAYGYSALFVGLSYLVGSLLNRALINSFTTTQLVQIGIGILALGAILQLILAILTTLSLGSLLFPAMIVQFSLGFIFGNVLGACLQFFPNYKGMSVALQTGCLMVISSCGLFFLSHIDVEQLYQFGIIYSVFFVIFSSVMYFKRHAIFALTG